MELRQLRYFLRVADFKSFSRAALAVRIAQPALSRHIRKLEEEMGVALFYRDGRGAILTEQGQRYYERVTDILRQLDQAAAELQTDYDMPTGEVALGVPTELGPALHPADRAIVPQPLPERAYPRGGKRQRADRRVAAVIAPRRRLHLRSAGLPHPAHQGGGRGNALSGRPEGRPHHGGGGRAVPPHRASAVDPARARRQLA